MEDTKSRLLDSALAVFAERGADGGSMREIARRAGVNVATAYHHFGSKRDLLLAVFRDLKFIDSAELDTFEWPADGRDPVGIVEDLLLVTWLFLATGANVVRVAVQEALKGDADVLSVFDDWQQQGDARIERDLLRFGLATDANVGRRALTLRLVIWSSFVEALMQDDLSEAFFRTRAEATAISLLESWRS
jgi:AcrR family transcriptional regulator